MQTIRQTSAGVVSATADYAVIGLILFAGTSAKLTNAAGRDILGIPAVGTLVLPSPIQAIGLTSVGTFSDLYILVE